MPRFLLLAFFVNFVSRAAFSQAAAEHQPNILWYDQPARSWMTEALPLGNGWLKDKNKKKWNEAVVAGDMVWRDLERGQMSRDMTLFVDDDRKGYLLSSGEDNLALHLHELTDDYRGFTGKWTRIFPGESNEAPALFKRAGKYFLFASGTSGWFPNPGRSAMADSIWGPWTALGNPCRGTERENAITLESQSTYVLPVPGRPGEFIYMGDRWRPKNTIDGRYVWLPVEWENDRPVLRWHAEWDLSVFARHNASPAKGK